jgi:small subunit ribosomal protein S2
MSYDQLLGQNIHVGSVYNPEVNSNNNIIYGIRNGYTIINLEQTLFYFRKLSFFFKEIVWFKGIILITCANLVSIKFSASVLKNTKYLTYFSSKWPGGLFTNFKHFRNRILSNQNLTNFRRLPDALFVITNYYKDYIIPEANRLNIPVFAIVNSSTNISKFNIDYMLPGNSDSTYAIKFYIYILVYLFSFKQVEQRISYNF